MMKAGRVAVVVFFCLAKVALSHADSAPSAPIRDPNVSDIFIPADLGYVTETSQPASSASPLIIHIQEAHTNYESQRHLIDILKRLIEQQNLKLILVEGGSGDVGLSYLRGFGSPENRKDVAEKYLKLGILSGEEYLDIVSDTPLILWGVEQEDLYQQNVKAFLDVESLQAAAKPVLDSLRDAVNALKPVVSDPALLELEAKRTAFDQEELGLAAYGEFVGDLARQQGISESEFPELARFLDVHQVEQDLKLDQVQQEQQALLTQLSTQLPPDAFDGLIAKARRMKSGELKPEQFYTSLESSANASQVELPEQYPHLFLYIRYVTQSARVAPTALSDELEQLVGRLRAKLTLSPESRQLAAVDEQLDLVQKLVGLELSPEEYKTFQALSLEGLCSGWERALNDLLTQHGQPRRTFERLAALQAMLPTVQQFYQAANDRDQALVDNALAKVRASGERTAVLITGGFHAPRISRLLKEEGVGLVVVAPKIGQATDEQLYRAVLKYKSGRGKFEDVMAVANRTSTPVAH